MRGGGPAIASLTTAAAAMVASAALAQPQLASVEPSKGATVDSVDHVEVRFDSALVARSSSLTIQMSAPKLTDGVSFGGALPTPGVTMAGVDPADAHALRMSFAKPLAPGFYTVRWRAAGSDGRAARGLSSFIVK